MDKLLQAISFGLFLIILVIITIDCSKKSIKRKIQSDFVSLLMKKKLHIPYMYTWFFTNYFPYNKNYYRIKKNIKTIYQRKDTCAARPIALSDVFSYISAELPFFFFHCNQNMFYSSRDCFCVLHVRFRDCVLDRFVTKYVTRSYIFVRLSFIRLSLSCSGLCLPRPYHPTRPQQLQEGGR